MFGLSSIHRAPRVRRTLGLVNPYLTGSAELLFNEGNPSVKQTGTHNENHGSETFGLRNLRSISWNDDARTLYDTAIARGEGEATKEGAFATTTGKHTGRSATDKFIVRDSETETNI